MDNRAMLKRLNKAVGMPRNAEIEDLSDSEIQIYGFDGCRKSEQSQIPDEYGQTGAAHLLMMLLDPRTLPETGKTIRDYFAQEYDSHKKKLLRGHIRSFMRQFKQPASQKILDEIGAVIGD